MTYNDFEYKNHSTMFNDFFDSTPKRDRISISESFLLSEAWLSFFNTVSATSLSNIDSLIREKEARLSSKDFSKYSYYIDSDYDESKKRISSEMQKDELIYNKLVDDLANRLQEILSDFSLESETISPSEELICNIANKYSLRLLGEVLTKIYISCYDHPNIIAGICYSLERFDSSEVSPWGQSIVIGLINHKSDLVKERVISLIDNWGDTMLIPSLKNIEISSDWMREYVNSVISYLEDKNVLFEKTV